MKKDYGTNLTIATVPDENFEHTLKTKTSNLSREIYIRNTFKHAYNVENNKKHIDFVFIPYLDYCLYAIGLLGSPFKKTTWGGICMRPSFHHKQHGVISPTPKLSKLKEIIFTKILSIKSLGKIFTIDETLKKHIELHHSEKNGKISYLADPAELVGNHTSVSARLELGIPNDANVILVYGSIDERKGVRALVKAIKKSSIKNTHLLLVGKQSESIKEFLAHEIPEIVSKHRYHYLDRFVTDEEQQMVFAASNIVWLGYQNHFTMSGVLVLAALSGKPVIGTNKGLIGWYIKEKEIGCYIDATNEEEINTAINLLTTNYNPADQLLKRAYFTNHNWDNFNEKLNANLAP